MPGRRPGPGSALCVGGKMFALLSSKSRFVVKLPRQRVAELARVLAQDDAAEARDLVRSLVETITLVPADSKLGVEVRGELAAILRLAEGARHANGPGNAEALAAQIKLVAGAGNHRQLTPVRVAC